MPNIAQKLCHDIVEPELKRSTKPITGKSANKFTSSSTKRNVKPPRFVHNHTQANSKTKISHTNGVTVLKSKASILKSLADTAVNTIVTGPLRCDNNCVTLVRRRDNQRSCKCGHKSPNIKASAKSIQTLLRKDFNRTDKACTHCVETATCGTQLLKNNSLPGNQKRSKSTITIKVPVGRLECSTELSPYVKRYCCHNHLQNNAVEPCLRYVTAKQWALSHYPTRGPDF